MSIFSVNLPEWSARDHSHRVRAGFVPVPRANLYDVALKPGARVVLAVLRDHARTTGRCWASQMTISAEAGMSENTLRKHLGTLITAGLITRRRRGLGLTNIYELVDMAVAVPEPQILRANERLSEKEKERTVSVEQSTATTPSMDISHNPDTISGLQCGWPPTLPLMPSPPDHDRTAVTNLMSDLRRELGDRATVGATMSRVLRLYQHSSVPWDQLVTAVYAARATTRAHQHRIRRRDREGVNAFPYFMRVLEERLGQMCGNGETLVPTQGQVLTDRQGADTHSQPAEGTFDHLVVSPSPPPPHASKPNREAFWREMRTATGIADLAAYCQVVGRPPVYGDMRRSIGLVQERRR